MPCKAVHLSNGGLGEINVPCLFIAEKSGGSWATVKASPTVNHLTPTKVVEILIEGWYQIKDNEPTFFLMGDTFNLGSGTTWLRGPWQ